MEWEIGVTQSIIDELHSSDIQRDEMEGESGVTQSIIDEVNSWNIQADQIEGESDVTQVSLMNFVFRISNEIKWKVKVVIFEVSLMKFILGISK